MTPEANEPDGGAFNLFFRLEEEEEEEDAGAFDCASAVVAGPDLGTRGANGTKPDGLATTR